MIYRVRSGSRVLDANFKIHRHGSSIVQERASGQDKGRGTKATNLDYREAMVLAAASQQSNLANVFHKRKCLIDEADLEAFNRKEMSSAELCSKIMRSTKSRKVEIEFCFDETVNTSQFVKLDDLDP